MADNVAITAGTGPSIATDDVGGVQYQRIKNGFGVDGAYADVSPAAGLPVGASYTELTASITSAAVVIAQTDVRSYSWLSVMLTGGGGSNTVRVEASIDATNWFFVQLQPVDASSQSLGPQFSATPSTTLFYVSPILARYLRASCTTYASGTSVLTIGLHSSGYPDWTRRLTVQGAGSALAVTGATATPPSDGQTTFAAVSVANYGFNGTNWRRLRAAVATSAVTSVAAATSSTSLLASNTSREQAMVTNESASATLYLKLGATASLTSYTVAIPPGGYYEVPLPIWTGSIDGIWSAAVGNARITELS